MNPDKSENFRNETVLVTGGSGYLAGWIIVGLLKKGYKVRTTIRNLDKKNNITSTFSKHVNPENRLAFYKADLMSDEGWDKAVDGADFVIHVASPMGVGSSKGVTDLVTPALEGTLRVLRASIKTGVKRVVMTSSVVASMPSKGNNNSKIDETVWTDENEKGISDYNKSKTVAERAAWELIKESKSSTTLTTILPSFMVGPILGKEISPSVEIISRLLTGKLPRIPRIGFNTVDVRDAADLHIRAMESEEASGERLIADSNFIWLEDMAKILREQLGSRASKVPTKLLPDFILKIVGLFSDEAKRASQMLGPKKEFTHAKAEKMLDWHPRIAKQAIIDCSENLIKEGLV